MPVYIWDLPVDQYGEMILVVVEAEDLHQAETLVASERPGLLDRVKVTFPKWLGGMGPQLLVYEAHQ